MSEDEDDIALIELSKRIRRQKMKDITDERPLHQPIASQEESDIKDSRFSDIEEDSTSNQDTQEKPEEMLIDEKHASPLVKSKA